MKKAESEREAKIHSDLEEKPVPRLISAVVVSFVWLTTSIISLMRQRGL